MLQNKVRIVGGSFKRTPLTVPNLEGLRPTPDRVREALFNWLGSSIQGARCLDLFAGTGALGIEALSRGAASVVLVETQRRAIESIQNTLGRLKNPANIAIKAMSAENYLAQTASRFDVIFLDPPFGSDWLSKVAHKLPALLAPNGVVYVEAEAAQVWQGWEVRKSGKAGQVYYHLMALNVASNASAADSLSD